MEPLEKMQPMGLKYPLASEQPTEHTNTGIR